MAYITSVICIYNLGWSIFPILYSSKKSESPHSNDFFPDCSLYKVWLYKVLAHLYFLNMPYIVLTEFYFCVSLLYLFTCLFKFRITLLSGSWISVFVSLATNDCWKFYFTFFVAVVTFYLAFFLMSFQVQESAKYLHGKSSTWLLCFSLQSIILDLYVRAL